MTIKKETAQFYAAVADATGIDPRVELAWQQAEGAPGYTANNPFNIMASTAQGLGYRDVSTLAGGVAGFKTAAEGEAATIAEIRAAGLAHEKGKTAGTEIADIGASHWGTNPTTLLGAFRDIWGQGSEKTVYSGQFTEPYIVTALTEATAGSAADITSGGITGDVPPIPDVTNIAGGLTGAVEGIASAFEFIFSIRFLEVLGGLVLLAVGLSILSRQLGGPAIPAPVPSFLSPPRPSGQGGDSPEALFEYEPGASRAPAPIPISRARKGGGRVSRSRARPSTGYDPATAEIPYA